MKFTFPIRVPASKRTLSLLAVTLLVGSVAGLLAQSAPYDPVLERRLWKELLPWGENTGPNGEVIWTDREDLNNIPSSSPASIWIDDFGEPVLRSVTPHGTSTASALAAAQTEFGLLGAIGECTFSHPGDYDLDDAIYWPQVRLCKGPQVPGGPANTFAQLPPAPGRLLNPVGIAVSGAKVFVGDSFNHRIQAFDFYGNNIPMKYPIGNGIPGADFYDYDAQYPGLNYRPYPGLTDGGFSGHQLHAPQGVAVDAREIAGEASPRLLVGDTNNNRVALFNDDGSAAFGTQQAPLHFYPPIPADGVNGPPQGTEAFRPVQLAISPGAVIRAPGAPGAPGTPIGSNDPDFGKRIAVIDGYHCFVAITDVGFNVIKMLPAERPAQVQQHSCHLPEAGPSQPGQFSTITGVEIDAAGNIYISDHAQQQVQVFDRDGVYLTSIGKPGGTNPGGTGDLAGPVGLFIDDWFGRLGVIDADNARAVFYDISGGPAAVAFQFQIDTTVAVDDFPMGVAMQFGEEADGLDPKGRIMVTDPHRRRVIRWELPELVIANATATITNPELDPKTGVGSFDVVVPYQKLSPVNDVIVAVVPQDLVNVTVVPGTIVPTPASRPDIAFGQLVHYTFQFTSTVSEAKFDITARGDCDAEGLNCLAEAPDAAAIARALCDDCAASHEVFYDFPEDPDNPEAATLVDTTDQVRAGRQITGWYDEPVFVRIRPVVPEGIADDDPNRVTHIAWWYGGAGGLQYGTLVTEVPTPGSDDAVDASVRVSGVTWLTYQAITASGSASAPVEVLLPVDVQSPSMEFYAPSLSVPAWTPPTGNDGAFDWHNVPVTGHYRTLDNDSGAVPAPDGGVIEFTTEGRGQFVPLSLLDEAGNAEEARSDDTGRGGRAIYLDMTAPDFVNGLGVVINDFSDGLVFQVPFSGVDGNGLYANLSAGALTIGASDPLLSTGEPGSRPIPFAAGNLAASGLRSGDLITFRATDYAGNFRERTATIEITQAVATVQYVGEESVTYGGTLLLKAEVVPSNATGTVTFTIDGRTVTATLVDETGPGGLRRVATVPLTSVLSDVGTYTVTLAYSGDETLEPASNTYAVRVLKFPVQVTALPKEKVAGEPDPALEYVSVPAVEDLFLDTDAFVGTLHRDAPGSNTVGAYEIRKSSLALNNPNYELLFQPAAFKVLGIVPVTALPQRINFGTTPAPFTLTYGAFPSGTSLANVVTPPSCSVPGPHNQAGTYEIACDGGLGRVLDGNGQELVDQYGNPLLTFRYEPAELIIDRIAPVLTVTGGPFVYNGLTQGATCTVTGLGGAVQAGGVVSYPVNAPVNAGTTLADCSFPGNTNYLPATGSGSVLINQRPITVTADAKSKLLGALDPVFTYSITAGSLVAGDSLTGTLTRNAGELLGVLYPILQGTLTAGPNYALSYVPANLTILALNLPPLAFDDTASSAGAAPVTITVLANDRDVDGGTLSVTGVTQPTGGQGVVTTSGNLVVFTPTPGFAGTVTFTYTISDGNGGSATANVTVTVTEPVCNTGAVALVRQQVMINSGSRTEGSIHVMTAADVTFNGGTLVGDLLMLGTPTIQINGTPAAYAGAIDGTGAATPNSHRVTINSGVSLGRVVRRTAAVWLPTVANPPAPEGTRSVSLNTPADSPGNFATLRDLTLNSNVGAIAVPAGTYGSFIANSGSSFVIGVAGATTPAVYNFETLTLNSNSGLQVVGPVVVTLKNQAAFNAPVGASAHPEWLKLRIANGGLNLNSGSSLYGFVDVPSGEVIINDGTQLVGGLTADKLTLNSNGRLILRSPCNQPPTVSAANRTDTRGTTANVQITGVDDDGDALVYTATGLPPGTSMSSTGLITGTLTTSGVYTVNLTVTDPSNATGTGSFVWTVVTPNVPPVAVDNTATSVGAAPVTIAVLGNDSDSDGGTLTLTAITQPAGGAAVGVVTTSGDQLVFTPAPNFVGTATFTYTISDGQGGTATATVTVTITAPSSCTANGYLTYSQGGWGNSGAPGQFLAAHFTQVYPSGVTIGGVKTLKFTSANAINAFLPAGGSPAVLTSSAVNPTSSSAGNFAAQLLAMRLAVDYSAAGKSKVGLGELVMLSGPFAGSTVNQILAVANAVIGGQTSALPSGMSISTLSGILESLNMNHHEGTVNNGLLGCPGQCIAGSISLNTSSYATSGTAGNIRTYAGAGGVSVKASAFSRARSNGAWSSAFLGAFGSAGLGVTDGSEGDGSSDKHKLDNVGDRLNYILFEFSKPVVVNRAFLTYIGADGDATVWIGTKTDPFNNHLTLSDAVLASLGTPQSSASTSTADRWATFNGGSITGNVLVIAADVTDSSPEDAFKIAKLDITCATASGQPPTVTASNQTNNEGSAVSLQITANHPDNDDLTYAVTGLPPGLSVNPATGLVTGTLDHASAGTYNVTVTVTDDAGATATASFVWTVASVNRAPMVSAANRSDNKGVSVNVQISGTDPDGDTLTYTATGLPPGATMTTAGKITGTLTTLGTYTVTVTVKDPSNAAASASFTWTVANPSAPPDAINDSASVKKGKSVDISVLSNDKNDHCSTLKLKSVTQPSQGTVVMLSNGKVRYTAPSSWTGTTTFTYTISDEHGGVDTATVTVTVKK